MSAVEQRRLSFDERVTLKQLIDAKTRSNKNISKGEIKKYSYPDYIKRWQLERRREQLAKEGLVIYNANDDYVLCTHCDKRSSKLTRKDKRHEEGCPRTPIEVTHD